MCLTKTSGFTAAKTQCWQRYIRVPQQPPLTASKVSKRGPLEPIGTPECCLVAYFSQTNLRISQLNLNPFQDGNACHAIFATFSSQHYAACFSNLLQIIEKVSRMSYGSRHLQLIHLESTWGIQEHPVAGGHPFFIFPSSPRCR